MSESSPDQPSVGVSASNKWFAYGVAMTAAGWAASSAHAAVVYTPGPFNYGANGGVDIDFDQDPGPVGENRDAYVGHLNSGGHHVLKETTNASDDLDSGALSYLAQNGDPSNLAFGTVIGPTPPGGMTYQNSFNAVLVNSSDTDGNFSLNSSTTEYIGVKFYYRGEPTTNLHYGWIGVENLTASGTGTVTGYAYETDLNTPISAGAVPEPAALGVLALGALGATCRRPKRSSDHR